MVFEPLHLHLAGLRIDVVWADEQRLVDAVGKLEGQGQHEAESQRHSQEHHSDHRCSVPRPVSGQRQDRHDNYETGLADPEADSVPALGPGNSAFANLASSQGLKIVDQLPTDSHEPVEEEEVVLLVSLITVPRLERRHSSQWSKRDVGVPLFDVGVGVVGDVVLYPPHITATTHGIQCVASGSVEPLMAAEPLVVAVVHDIEADGIETEGRTETGQAQLPPVVGD